MTTLTAPHEGKNLLTPPSSTTCHGMSVMKRLNRRRVLQNKNEIVTLLVTPNDEEEIMTPRKLLATMSEYQAQNNNNNNSSNIHLVHVGKYIISLQPENCRSLAALFEEESNNENAENNPIVFAPTSYATPPRTTINNNNNKHFLSPPTTPPATKKPRTLQAPPGLHIPLPTLDEGTNNYVGSELGPTSLKPRNLNLTFHSTLFANDTTLA
ncbi:unnamed protein product [Cylindrotheca closterium]|uniref:Uncharacterized protein n=1 Tax=Cylindrotheca closterium TaxID=2856 RepID=A0AAD2FQ46_9STRA|nr:unnamed protein product [Cylindrotheca closterium]